MQRPCWVRLREFAINLQGQIVRAEVIVPCLVSLYIRVNVKVVFTTEAENQQSLISLSTAENCS